MERFERACGQVLPTYKAGSVPPTLEQLGELGVLPVPRRVGGFLCGTEGAPLSAPQDEPEDELMHEGLHLSRVVSGIGAYLDSLLDEMDTEDEEEDDLDAELSFEELSAAISEAAQTIMSSLTS